MREVHVGLVEYGDLPRQKPRADLPRPLPIVVGGCVHDRERRQEALQVQAQVQLRRGLAPAMACPVDAVHHQTDRRGVHRVDRPLEAPRHPAERLPPEPGTHPRQVVQDLPEERLSHFPAALAIGVGERVLGRRRRVADPRQFRRVVLQRVAHVVQTQSVRELSVQERHQVRPRAERARLLRHAALARDLGNQEGGNQVA